MWTTSITKTKWATSQTKTKWTTSAQVATPTTRLVTKSSKSGRETTATKSLDHPSSITSSSYTGSTTSSATKTSSSADLSTTKTTAGANTATSVAHLIVKQYFTTTINIQNIIVINNYNTFIYKEEISIKVFAAFEFNLINYYCSSRKSYFTKLCDACQIVKVSKVYNSIEVPTCPDCPAKVIPEPKTVFTVTISVEERKALVGAVVYSSVEYTRVIVEPNYTVYKSTWKSETARVRPTDHKGPMIPGKPLIYQNCTTHTVPYATGSTGISGVTRATKATILTGPSGKSDAARATEATVPFEKTSKAKNSLASIVRALEQSGGVVSPVDSDKTDVNTKAAAGAAKHVGGPGVVESPKSKPPGTGDVRPLSLDKSLSIDSATSKSAAGSNSVAPATSESELSEAAVDKGFFSGIGSIVNAAALNAIPLGEAPIEGKASYVTESLMSVVLTAIFSVALFW